MSKLTYSLAMALLLCAGLAMSGGAARAQDNQDQQQQDQQKKDQQKKEQQKKHQQQQRAQQPPPQQVQPPPQRQTVQTERWRQQREQQPVQTQPPPQQPRWQRLPQAPSATREQRTAPTTTRLPQPQQQQLIVQQQHRTAAFSDRLRREELGASSRERQLEGQHRMAQLRYQQQYLNGLRLQEQYLSREGAYDYSSDPFFYTPPTYTFYYGGQPFYVNDYGADVLRDAVNFGYQQGYGSGAADREDGWRADPQGSYAYQDALYGYNGMYVDPDEYAYYFRQGFQRGYEDGYFGRYRYGVYVNGTLAIIGSILDQILDLRPIR